MISPGVPLLQNLQWESISVLSTVKKKKLPFLVICTKLLTQIEKTVFPKGVLNMLRRVLCFRKDTCQNLTDIPSIEKCLASTVSLRISSLVDSRKQPCYAYFFNSFGSLIAKCFMSPLIPKEIKIPSFVLIRVLRKRELRTGN